VNLVVQAVELLEQRGRYQTKKPAIETGWLFHVHHKNGYIFKS
jgi:hypothetical protein